MNSWHNPATRAVILAAGRGRRMQVGHPHTPLSTEQRAMAEAGWKTLIPIHGRPFLAHLLEQLERGGIDEVCVVVGAGKHPVREYLEAQIPGRLRIHFAVQAEPRGTAHALACARSFLERGPAVVLNGDNLYPAEVIDAVRAVPGFGTAGFRAQELLGWSGQPWSRLTTYALLVVDSDGRLVEIEEKPSEARVKALGSDPLVSMNCWRVTPQILPVLADLQPSVRGEFELPDAIRVLQVMKEPIEVVPVAVAVPDLTSVEDISRVTAFLASVS